MKDIIIFVSSFILGYVYRDTIQNIIKRGKTHKLDALMIRLEEIKPCKDCLTKDEENKILESKLEDMELSEKDLEIIMEELVEDEVAPPNVITPPNSEEEGSIETDITASEWYNIFT